MTKQLKNCKMVWEKSNSIIYSINGEKRKKILGLDMDNTIIKTKSNAKFAKDTNDW